MTSAPPVYEDKGIAAEQIPVHPVPDKTTQSSYSLKRFPSHWDDSSKGLLIVFEILINYLINYLITYLLR